MCNWWFSSGNAFFAETFFLVWHLVLSPNLPLVSEGPHL